MTRPALIVGLGGTGQWILTYLKKDLIESNGGMMPENVRLLAFDTMPQASAEADTATMVPQEEQDIRVGAVQLETGSEFIHIGGDMYTLGETISQGSETDRRAQNHVASWFAANHWMQTLPRASWVLAAGAGQLRQFGRLGLFRDLSDPGRSDIWNRIDVNLRSLERGLRGQRLEIIVVGSFAGGTGSGMFIDIGLLLRERTKGIDSLIRGYFALPRVFDQDPDDDMKARAFAAWRELNRFMTVSATFPMPSIIYNPGDHRLQLERVNKKVYDACYLIDGKQGPVRIDAEPERIIFPAIADAISALLDDTAGAAYTEWVVANLAPEYAAKPGIALYSAVGAHSYKVPIYYSQQEFSHKLSLNLLNNLVNPIYDDVTNRDRVTGVSPTSPYSPVRIGRDDSSELLTKDFSYAGNSEETTLFTKRIADVIQAGGANNDALVEAYAAGSLYRAGGRGRNWVGDFTEFGSRAEIRDLTNEIQKAASLSLMASIKPSKEIDEDPKAAPARFARSIPPFVQKNYGGRTAEGADYGGSFGDALEQARNLQVDIFRRNAQLWLMYTLMGNDPERATVGRSGRIGYAYDLLDGLVEQFSAVGDFLTAVDNKRREAIQPRLRAEEVRNQRLRDMKQQSNRKVMGFYTPPQVYTSQERYLRAEQAVIDVRKDELLQRAVEDTVRAMQAVAAEMRGELERWIQMLATGDPATGVTSLHQMLRANELAIVNTAEADQRLVSQTTISGPDYREDSAELERMMRSVIWELKPHESFRLHLSIGDTDTGATELERTSGTEKPELRAKLTQRNLQSVLRYADRRFSQLPGETRVAQKLAEQYSYEAMNLVRALGDKPMPFFARREPSNGGAAKWARLVRVSMDRDKLEPRTFEFVEEIQTELRRTAGVDLQVRDQNQLVEVVGSADPHKCTVVYTDDLYRVELFEAWSDCQQSYVNNPKYPPHLNHNFPAEATAAQMELELSRRRRTAYRVFHPWVVMLLEHKERLEMFLIAWALDWIKFQEDGVNVWYELQPPDYQRGLMLTEPARQRPSLFQVIHAFVLIGQDRAPHSNWFINYDELTRSLFKEEQLLEADMWIKTLRAQLHETPDQRIFVPWISDFIDELEAEERSGRSIPSGEPADYVRAYEDLSEVSALILEKRIEEKEQQQTRRR
ncbi:hypothetical protein KC887_01685 [Candidatus Kaiserbacteria bacterium]|nr:hypothetical protein [Candidatus Kaiserbacteria bacterium]